jgi:hypothetical protein
MKKILKYKDFKMNICCDAFDIIFSFLGIKDLEILITVNRSFYQSEKIWKEIGKREFPLLKIKNREDWILKNPFYISEREILDKINRFSFLYNSYMYTGKNRNNKTDHIPRTIAKSISRDIIIVEKLRNFRGVFLDTYERICVDILINDYLERSEKEADELKQYIKNYCRSLTLTDTTSTTF